MTVETTLCLEAVVLRRPHPLLPLHADMKIRRHSVSSFRLYLHRER